MTRPSRFFPSALIAAGACLLAGNVIRHSLRIWDDAYITFRFGERLAAGQGLVWNVGGERTEGYTSVLHVVIVAAARMVGVTAEALVIPLGVACTLATAAVIARTVRVEFGRLTTLGAVPIAMYLADEVTAIHATSGLETPLFTMLLALAAALGLRLLRAPERLTPWLLGVSIWLAALARPEGVLFGAAMLSAIASCVAFTRGPERRRALGGVTTAAGTAALLLATYAAWKWRYFGYLLPNPFYVKSDRLSLSGLAQVRQFVEHVAWRTGPVIIGLAALALARRERPAHWRAAIRTSAIGLVPAAVGLAYYVTIVHEVGGAHRFSFPTMALLTLAIASAGAACTVEREEATGLLAATAAGILLVLQPAWTFTALPRTEFDRYHRRIGEALRGTGLGSSGTILCDAAGVIPYLSGFNQVDRVGLVDNTLSGRVPLSPRAREQYLWDSRADVYLGYEPPASAGAMAPDSDPLMQGPYVTTVLMNPRMVEGVGNRIFVVDPDLLHARMRTLRDRWVWIGELDWPGHDVWGLRSFVYVRRGADPRLTEGLGRLVDQAAGQVDVSGATRGAAAGRE